MATLLKYSIWKNQTVCLFLLLLWECLSVISLLLKFELTLASWPQKRLVTSEAPRDLRSSSFISSCTPFRYDELLAPGRTEVRPHNVKGSLLSFCPFQSFAFKSNMLIGPIGFHLSLFTVMNAIFLLAMSSIPTSRPAWCGSPLNRSWGNRPPGER